MKLKIRHYCSIINEINLLDKFKGCLLGGLIGDCYGKPFKCDDEVSKLQLQKYFDKLNGPYFKSPYKPYSSSIAFAICIGESLVRSGRLNPVDLAERFVKANVINPHRDYGRNITEILIKLRASKFSDPFAPAQETFMGLGSFGNRAAARTAPIPLFYFGSSDMMVDVASQTSKLTHSHKLGQEGAILMSWAIRLALELDGNNFSDPSQYLSELKQKVDQFESYQETVQLGDAYRYKTQLQSVESLLKRPDLTSDHVANTLGHSKVALFSVPTAIYCFLRSISPVDGIETANLFRRTIQFAISLGGDTEAIGGMAGALAGACYGFSSIDQSLYLHCEGSAEILQLAEDLFNEHLKRAKT